MSAAAPMSPSTLFDLLPTVYRLRDADGGRQLEALVSLISEQAVLLQVDLEGLWDDLFVETCAEWVVPYIGDLVSNTPLYEIPDVGRRADVADTIHWRRRKASLCGHGVATARAFSRFSASTRSWRIKAKSRSRAAWRPTRT